MIFKLYWIIYAIYLLHIAYVNVRVRESQTIYNLSYSLLGHIHQVQQHHVREQRHEYLSCGVLLYKGCESAEELYEFTLYAAKTHTQGYRRKN